MRSLLHGNGARFRVDYPIRGAGARPIRPDIVFPGLRLAVFIDGCYWHSCPEHASYPITNAEWWRAKLAATRERDQRYTEALTEAGWHVMRIWEHEDVEQIAVRVRDALEGLRLDQARAPSGSAG